MVTLVYQRVNHLNLSCVKYFIAFGKPAGLEERAEKVSLMCLKRWLTVDQMSTASSLLPPFALQDFDAPSISFLPSGNHHQTWALIWQNNRTTSWIFMDFPCLIARG